MRVSLSCPIPLTFSRKHSCLRSCSLGRGTHYFPLSPPGLCLSRGPHRDTDGCHASSHKRAPTRALGGARARPWRTGACPGETLKCAPDRANAHAGSSFQLRRCFLDISPLSPRLFASLLLFASLFSFLFASLFSFLWLSARPGSARLAAALLSRRSETVSFARQH